MNLLSYFYRWASAGNALSDRTGKQDAAPSSALVADAAMVGPDVALQISTVWACIDRRAKTIASLPFFAYESVGGKRSLARQSRLWTLLHESPNQRMTPYEFWVCMIMNHDLRGNAYARIDRDPRTGEAIALWPMAADQVELSVLDDGSVVYAYRLNNDLAFLKEENVLHLKDMGNGTVGLPRLDYMRATASEAKSAQLQSHRLFAAAGKPTGVLMVDQLLKKEQREKLQERFAEMQAGNTARLFVLEANMKYQQLSLSPEDQQLLETRKFEVEEICRWFDVPPVLVHHSNVTTWGSGIEQIVDGFYKFSVRPMLVSIEQSVRKRVMTPKQRTTMSAEFSLDALLRASLKDRMEIYGSAVQNGIYNRNECRQLENAEPYEGGELFTAQVNLAPVNRLGLISTPAAGSAPDDI
jgi:HK97 family phage portal protein